MAKSAFEQDLEAKLRNAAYTAVGLGVLAYRFSEPQRKKLEAEGRAFWKARAETSADRRGEWATDLKEAAKDVSDFVKPARTAVEDLLKKPRKP